MSSYQWVALAAMAFFTALAAVSFLRAVHNRANSYADLMGFNVVGTFCVAVAIIFAVILASTL